MAARDAVRTNNTEAPFMSDVEGNAIDYDSWIGEEIDDEDSANELSSPWEGAVIYQRNSSISHLEYCTTLERLGLDKLSSDVSRSTASLMGLRVTKDVKDYVQGTPVLISVDVTRKKGKLRLDGIVKTVITLGCFRCGEEAGHSVFCNFSLLLTDEPFEEPEVINMGVIYRGDPNGSSSGTGEDEEDDDSVDLDDRLYFPPEQKEIDISKPIRDMVHLEITMDAICDSKCKGLCLNCGTNLNTSRCDCSQQEVSDVGSRPFQNLKKRMQKY